MGWIETERSGISFYQCRELNDEQVIQAFSTRNSGNLALHTGDDSDKVIERRKLWLKALELNLDNLVSGVQVHGTGVALVDETAAGSGAFSLNGAIRETDALITNRGGIILAVFTADCIPIFIYDPATPAIAVVHAGWRGAINGITMLAIRRMKDEFGTILDNCHVAIGPSICSACFKVDRQLAERFSAIHAQIVTEDESGSKVDLKAFIRLELTGIGVNPDRIHDAGLCTGCQSERFFSYRAEHGVLGRMMGIIALKKTDKAKY